MRQKFLEFLKDKKDFVPIAPFFKSMYSKEMQVHKPWSSLQEAKAMKIVISGLVNDGLIEVKGGAHLFLGKIFYIGDPPQTRHQNIDTLNLEARIL